ncbi:MAG TPA: DUF697 domain-containing protein [Oscillatoriaceae cyanobacterium M33_DOE_052]|uniref:DUF697 domain-containing protein n=1 Tax=Planktothricoides sp. SpSt-374 TaxID=2282167 RepID=A0A7C3VQN2_9CYAN|nr:DUF697 domain-containing protein [Oscillatoriaceae cyanobacterium M33_DOE_052]
MTSDKRQEIHINRARSSIRQALSWYSRLRRPAHQSGDVKQLASLMTQLERMGANLKKLEEPIIRIAAFGLVSRGKSAVVNALLGQKILPTGPIHGVTQWPRSVQWVPQLASGEKLNHLVVELIDTPGLDEVEGQARSLMAREVAAQADLILFVVAGDITRTEYEALFELRQAQKPIILAFNKIDLYPEQDRQAIYRQLQNLGGMGVQRLLSAQDIVMVAAEPAPVQVRVEWPDGRVSYEWETPPPQIEELHVKILEIVTQEGLELIALNALTQVRDAEAKIANLTIQGRQTEAEKLIWQFARYKGLAVAVNPIAFLDLLGGVVADLALIRALARLYGLPMTGYEAGKLWQQILFSGGGLLLSEILSGVMLGMGKSAAAVGGATGDGAGLSAYAGAAIAQATLAGYGTLRVGQAAQLYLENGCSWGSLGPDSVIRDILSQVDEDSACARLREDLQQQLQQLN